MSDKGITTPRSAQESLSTPKYPAVKDKNCPFCHQAFTSSSLGRHLDLYIKPKNPKPPDGIHMVEEIKRIRGNITRRHPRSTSNKKDDSTSASKDQLNDEDGSPIVESPSSLNIFEAGKVRPKYDDANWTTNGAVSSVPQRPTLNVPDRGRSVSRHVQQKTEFEQRRKASEEWINAKAAELALREVLSSVKDASTRSAGLGLFDFDPFTLNFPSLCLHVLPPPSTLFSPTPFPTSDSWSINPPGQKQFEALLRHIKERITIANRQRQHFQLPNGLAPPGYNPSAPNPLPTPPLLEVDGSKVISHAQEAFQHWKTLPEKQRQEAWQLEILRCYVRRGESCKEVETKLEVAERELVQLKASPWLQYGMDPVQYAQMMVKACCQSPQISVEMVRELTKQGVNVHSWDYDRLIEKWRGVVREQRKPSSGMSSQRSLSTCSSQHTPSRPYTGGSGMLNTSLHQVVGVNETSAETTTNSTAMSQPTSASTVFSVLPASDSAMDDDGGDQADGEGEDEDAEAEDEVDTAPQEYKISTPAQHSQRSQRQSHQPQQTPQQLRQQQQQHHHQVVQAWAQHNMSHHQHNQAIAQSQHQHIAQHLNGRAQQMLVETPVMMTMDGIEAPDDNFLDRRMTLGMSGLTESYAQLAGTGGG